MSNLSLRIITAFILGTVALWVSVKGGIYFFIFAMIVGMGLLYEWQIITKAHHKKIARFVSWGFYLIFALLLFYRFDYCAFFLFIAAAFLCLISGRSFKWVGLGYLYATLPVYALISIRGDSQEGLVSLIFLYAIVWGTDIGAYFIGKTFGGPKLSPRFSPKKTWSGAVGGVIIAILSAISYLFYIESYDILRVSLFLFIAFLSIVSQLGDICESAVKRYFHVKDSSNLLPGHGGVMDRMDGLIFAAILFYLVAFLKVGPKNIEFFLGSF